MEESKLWWPTRGGPRESRLTINLLGNQARPPLRLDSLQRGTSANTNSGIAGLIKARAVIAAHNNHQHFHHLAVIGKSTGEHDDVSAAERGSNTITTYFHSYSLVPGGAVPLPPALHTNNPGFTSAGHHLFGQQGCSLACTCTCTCTASIVSAHHPQLHQHHRALGTAAATVLLQPVEPIKDAMVSEIP